MMKRASVAVALLSVGALAAWMHRADVWVAPGATRERLAFVVGEARGSTEPLDNLQLVRVMECRAWPNARTFWEATGTATGEALREQSFEYGRPPAGLVTRDGPEALAPGCYVVDISGAGIGASACFAVGADGTVSERPGGPLKCEDHDRAT